MNNNGNYISGNKTRNLIWGCHLFNCYYGQSDILRNYFKKLDYEPEFCTSEKSTANLVDTLRAEVPSIFPEKSKGPLLAGYLIDYC